MNHTDMFMFIINVIFSNGFITFLLLSIGLYRLTDGINRVKFEQSMDDNRLDLIPDENVYLFWQRISKLNLHFGKFFIVYGIFLMVLGFIHLIMTSIFDPITPRMTKNGSILFLVWLTGLLIVRNNGWQPGEAYGLRYVRQKNQIFEYYQSQNFKPIAKWDMLKLYPITSSPQIATRTVKDVASSNFEQKLTPYGFYLYYLSSMVMAWIFVF